MKTSLPLKQVKLNTIAKVACVLFILMSIAGMSFGQTPQEYITISKSGPANANPGDLITYTITIGNGHPTDDWTGTITDILPDEFTYDSFITNATHNNFNLSGTTLTWTDLVVPQGKTEVITITGHAGKLGNTFTEQLNLSTYYMNNSNIITYLTNSVTLEYGSVDTTLTDNDTTEVEQICDFVFYGQEGEIKSSLGSTNK